MQHEGGTMVWLLVIASMTSAIIAILRRSWRWMLVSAVLYSPFAWYLDATPRFTGTLFILLFHLAAAFLLHRNRRVIASLLLMPNAALNIFIALTVIFQPVP